MRISDWSSDVCSSDLVSREVEVGVGDHGCSRRGGGLGGCRLGEERGSEGGEDRKLGHPISPSAGCGEGRKPMGREISPGSPREEQRGCATILQNSSIRFSAISPTRHNVRLKRPTTLPVHCG